MPHAESAGISATRVNAKRRRALANVLSTTGNIAQHHAQHCSTTSATTSTKQHQVRAPGRCRNSGPSRQRHPGATRARRTRVSRPALSPRCRMRRRFRDRLRAATPRDAESEISGSVHGSEPKTPTTIRAVQGGQNANAPLGRHAAAHLSLALHLCRGLPRRDPRESTSEPRRLQAATFDASHHAHSPSTTRQERCSLRDPVGAQSRQRPRSAGAWRPARAWKLRKKRSASPSVSASRPRGRSTQVSACARTVTRSVACRWNVGWVKRSRPTQRLLCAASAIASGHR